MAKKLFEQLLSKAGEIWSGTKTQDNQHMYIEDSSGLSGVAKYLAKQEEATRAMEEKTKSTQATGVEKYLARQQGSSPTAAAPKTFATGVEKYLSKQAPVAASSAKQPVATPKTGVGKYLAGIPLATESKTAPAAKKTQTQQSKPVTAKAPAAKPELAAATSKTPAPATKPVVAPSPAPGQSVLQCQASTSKGTQCKNTSQLTKIQRTINKKKYQFSACALHSGDTFKPYAPLLETH